MAETEKVIKELIFNVSTGEETIIYATDEEIAEQKARHAEAEALKLAEKAAAELAAKNLADLKTSAKSKLIAGEPLTAEEAEVIVL